MFINSFKKTSCINGCELFFDDGDFRYWENRSATSDEKEIINFLSNKINEKNKILHVGIGNSYLAKNISNFELIDGITISGAELKFAENLKIDNYNVHFINKLSINALNENRLSNSYDFIVDANLKSFSCCKNSFENLFQTYVSKLSKKGLIITGRKGMNWSRKVYPAYGFSFKNFIHKRLKEIDGPITNILSINQCEYLAKVYDLKLFYNEKICTFEKF